MNSKHCKSKSMKALGGVSASLRDSFFSLVQCEPFSHFSGHSEADAILQGPSNAVAVDDFIDQLKIEFEELDNEQKADVMLKIRAAFVDIRKNPQ